MRSATIQGFLSGLPAISLNSWFVIWHDERVCSTGRADAGSKFNVRRICSTLPASASFPDSCQSTPDSICFGHDWAADALYFDSDLVDSAIA